MITKLLAFLALIIIITYSTKSEELQWADKVVSFSSQAGVKEFSAYQALGTPSIMPYQGNSATSWKPKMPTDKIEWIRLKFAKKMYVSQIIVAENLNPGSIIKIILYDSLNQGRLVFSNNLIDNNSRGGKISYFDIDKTDFRTDEIKIEVNVIDYIDDYQIDAVGIADYRTNYQVMINHEPDSVDFVRERLLENINSPHSELAPIISQDGRTLVFTREGHPKNIGEKKKQDVWIAKLDSSGEFMEAYNPGKPINNENSNFAISISPNANTIFLGNVYYRDGSSKAGFSVTSYDGVNWTFPDSIIIRDYYNMYPQSSFCLGSNGKILITSIKREDSFGKTDLHVSFLQDDSTWSAPLNLGKVINTAEEELSPFLAADNKSLYFATPGRPGYGNCDMFVSKRLDDTWTNWSEPVNLGPQINTPAWDAYYSITADGNFAYFVSSDSEDDSEDIYRVRLPQSVKPESVVLVRGKVLNQKTKEPLSADIKYEILPEGTEVGIAKSSPLTGEYSIVLPGGKMYGFLAGAKGFVSVNENIDLKIIEEYAEIDRDLYLVPIEKGQTARINNIFFNYNEYDLLPESFSELNRLVKLLKDNSALKIQVIGHTDKIGSLISNQLLSNKRAKSVYDYLIEHNIEKSRLKIKGMGCTKPIADNSSDEGRQKNRRVEFLILEN